MKTCSHFNVLRFVGTSSWVNIYAISYTVKVDCRKEINTCHHWLVFVISIYSNCNFILETSFCTRVRQRSVKNSMFAFCWNAPHDFLKASVTSYLFTGWIKLNDFFVLMTNLRIYFDLNVHFISRSLISCLQIYLCNNSFLNLKLNLYRSKYIHKLPNL